MSTCPCGSDAAFDSCCGPYLAGTVQAPTAEALMRSRYVAFTKADVDYVVRTTAPEKRGKLDLANVREWATKAEWLGLTIESTEAGGAGDTKGMVEFSVRFRMGDRETDQHEISRFRRDDDRWLYVDGAVGPRPLTRPGPKVGRNDPCPCGSGKKFKQCCGR